MAHAIVLPEPASSHLLSIHYPSRGGDRSQGPNPFVGRPATSTDDLTISPLHHAASDLLPCLQKWSRSSQQSMWMHHAPANFDNMMGAPCSHTELEQSRRKWGRPEFGLSTYLVRVSPPATFDLASHLLGEKRPVSLSTVSRLSTQVLPVQSSRRCSINIGTS